MLGPAAVDAPAASEPVGLGQRQAAPPRRRARKRRSSALRVTRTSPWRTARSFAAPGAGRTAREHRLDLRRRGAVERRPASWHARASASSPQHGGEIDERPRHRRHRDAEVPRGVTRVEASSPPRLIPSMRRSLRVITAGRGPIAPHEPGSCAAAAPQRSAPDPRRGDRRGVLGLRGRRGVPDAVDAPMDHEQRTRSDTRRLISSGDSPASSSCRRVTTPCRAAADAASVLGSGRIATPRQEASRSSGGEVDPARHARRSSSRAAARAGRRCLDRAGVDDAARPGAVEHDAARSRSQPRRQPRGSTSFSEPSDGAAPTTRERRVRRSRHLHGGPRRLVARRAGRLAGDVGRLRDERDEAPGEPQVAIRDARRRSRRRTRRRASILRPVARQQPRSSTPPSRSGRE